MLSNATKVISLNLLAQRMRKAGVFPAGIQSTKCGAVFAFTAYDETDVQSTVMHRNSCVGLSTNQYTAALKALTEWLERKVVRSNPAGFPHGTDGVAGWDLPLPAFRRSAARMARNHAVAEACERFIWSTWWDNPEIGHGTLSGGDLTPIINPTTASILAFVTQLFGGGELVAIRPHAHPSFPHELTIGAFLLPNRGGIITGGAAAPIGCAANALAHGMTELLRHAVALKRTQTEGISPETVYEKRLVWMGSRVGFDAMNERLTKSSRALVEFPGVSIDRSISDNPFDFAVFHHFNFRNHVEFIGSTVERACL